MLGQCGLCGGPDTSGHNCPGMVRNCRMCGGVGLGDVTHVCAGLSRSCTRCGTIGGADYTHLCSGPLSYPYVGPVTPSFTIIHPQVIIVQPIIVIQPVSLETTITTTCLSSAAA